MDTKLNNQKKEGNITKKTLAVIGAALIVSVMILGGLKVGGWFWGLISGFIGVFITRWTLAETEDVSPESAWPKETDGVRIATGENSRVKKIFVIIGAVLIVLVMMLLGLKIGNSLLSRSMYGSIGVLFGARIAKLIFKKDEWAKETRKVRITKYVLIAIILLAIPILSFILAPFL